MTSEHARFKEIISTIRKHHLIKQFCPKNLRETLEDLGPTFVKIGQIMSARDDMLPQEYCKELEKLRSKVRPMNPETVVQILQREYQGQASDIFESIEDTVLGAASIAEVHRAILKTGDSVVIKIQRENIQERMALDVKLLKRAIRILRLNRIIKNTLDLTEILDEIYRTAKEEMDFLTEANHMEEFCEKNREIAYLKIPKVYHEYTTPYVLVMEYIDGVTIDRIDLLQEDGYDLEEISQKLATNYIKQAIDDGYFHADPHADNIKIENGKIVFLDFGMMGRLDAQNKKLLKECIVAILYDDITTIERILLTLGETKQEINHHQLQQEIKKILDQNKTAEISNIDLREFLNDMLSLLATNRIKLPKDITMLLRGIIVIEGVLEEINPDISLIQVLKDFIKSTHWINHKEMKDLMQKGYKNGRAFLELPSELLTLLRGINHNQESIRIENHDSKMKAKENRKLVNRLLLVLLDVALLIGLSVMTISPTETLPFLFYLYATSATVITLILLWNLFMDLYRK